MAQRVVKKVWEFPVRMIHWMNFIAIVTLIASGIYIHWPYITPDLSGDLEFRLMGYMRYAHLIAGWMLMIGLVGRFVWGFIGNRYAANREFFPIFYGKRRRDLVEVFKYYLFINRHLPPHLGHNALASMAYLGIFVVMWFQVITGFALYSQYDPTGEAFAWFGWVFSIASNGWVRLGHYFVTFVFLAFFIFHIYAMWISDIAERDGTAGSMFSGYKYGEIEEFEDADHRPWKSFDDRRRARLESDGEASGEI